MPWPENDDWPEEPSCELCMKTGHTITSCPTRDDDDFDNYDEGDDLEPSHPLREPDLPPEPAPDAHLEQAYEDRFAGHDDL